ncbi:GNAT family N-acetyltransferase [Rhodobacteraceae bacterium]|nr:GNAT family N-acetyltransferase [Paracoccaceae bacterium]
MTPPTALQLFEALDATWPAARVIDAGPWRLREGQGGGQRVSSTTRTRSCTESDLETAIAGMQAIDQLPLFMIRADDADLDALLERQGYAVSDPTAIYYVSAADIARDYPRTTSIPAWPPLAIQREIWAEGGVGNARLAIMERVAAPKTSLLIRIEDTPAATVFLAGNGPITMLHALDVQSANRRRSVGEVALRSAAKWALDHGCHWLALAVTKANDAANALYQKLGMTLATTYHYRTAPIGGL